MDRKAFTADLSGRSKTRFEDISMRFSKLLVAGIAALWATTASAQQPLRVGFIPVMGAAQIFVAEGEGWLKQAGLNFQPATFESGPNMIQALSSGTLDVYVAGLAPILVARSKGIDVRVVASTVVEEMGFAAGPALAPLFAGRKPAEAFKAFREKNNRPAKLATQPLGSGPNTALATGAVEGGSVREPAWTILQKQSPNIKLIATGKEMFPNFPGVVVAVLGSFADKNPKAVDDLVRSVVRATKLLKEKPEQAVKHIGAAFGKGLISDDILLTALKSPQTQFTSDPRTIVESTAKLQDYQVKIGALKKAESLDGLFAQAVYDRAIAGN
jgi:NitT/TauT family transport system substrate-binding protein